MPGSGHLISGLDVATGSLALMIVSAGIACVAVLILLHVLLSRMGRIGIVEALWIGGFAVLAVVFGFAALERSRAHDQAAERRAVEARATELTLRAVAPGSALSCLDEVASTVVESACEKPLFASPEAVAAAVAYVDARVSLLADGADVARRDPSFRPVVERLRRSIEADRYGIVAHVLAMRGCAGAGCPELGLLHDQARVLANMKARVFEASLGAHALSWPSSAAGAVSPPIASTLPAPALDAGAGSAALPGGSGTASPATATPGSDKFDYPSASSIPPVSIMTPEPSAPPAAAKPVPIPKRAARKPAAHETNTGHAAPAPAPVPAAPSPAPRPAETSGPR